MKNWYLFYFSVQGFQQKFTFHSKDIVAISCSWCKQAVSMWLFDTLIIISVSEQGKNIEPSELNHHWNLFTEWNSQKDDLSRLT